MKHAVRCALLAAVALAVPTTASVTVVKPEEAGLAANRLQRITDMVQRHIAAGDLAGAVTVVARRGKVAHLAAQGVMDLDSKQPMTPASMFRIASMTKPVIGVSIMMLVEEGRLHLNDPVARYIPQFANMKVAMARPATGGSEGPAFYTVPAQRAITIKDLLTHTSGLGSGPMGDSEIAKVARKDGDTLSDYIPRLGGTVLEFQPGSRWTYSPGAGFETLGRIIEIASGMPLDRFFQTRIFDPLAMRDITFWPTDAQMPRVATVYQSTPNVIS
jgi:CubicO group peptidase (beta-lactamase class C family)